MPDIIEGDAGAVEARFERIAPPPWRDLPPMHNARATQYQSLTGRAASFPGKPTPDLRRHGALGMRRKCAECGCDLGPTVYQVFTSSPEFTSHSVLPGGLYTCAGAPMHKGCALYATLVCPFLRYPTSRSRPRNAHRGGGEIVGFRNYGVFLACGCPGCVWSKLGIFDFGYFDVVERHPYRSGKDNVAAYEQAVADEAVDTSTRFYWSDSPADERWLKECRQADRAALRTMQGTSTVVGGHAYPIAVV